MEATPIYFPLTMDIAPSAYRSLTLVAEFGERGTTHGRGELL